MQQSINVYLTLQAVEKYTNKTKPGKQQMKRIKE